MTAYSANEPQCPRCLERLAESNSSGYATRKCLYCNGIWIGRASLEALLSEEKSAISLDDLVSTILGEGTHSESDRACPACTPKKLHHVRVGPADLDLCPACGGIFFDEGEIEQVLPSTHKPHGPEVGTALAAEGVFWGIVAFIFSYGE